MDKSAKPPVPRQPDEGKRKDPPFIKGTIDPPVKKYADEMAQRRHDNKVDNR